MIILKTANFLRKNLTIFHDVKKIEIYFPYNTFVSYICSHRILKSKLCFIIFEGLFEWQKLNKAIATFKQTSITCRSIIDILYEPRNDKQHPVLTGPPSTGQVTVLRESFNTYQRYFYFQFCHQSDQSKIFQNFYVTFLGLPLKQLNLTM